jgi:O-antigen biosynthesis protein
MQEISGKIAALFTDQCVRAKFTRCSERSFCGFVVDLGDQSRKFTLEILVDGYVVRVIRADGYVHELAQDGVGDGWYGFSFSLHEIALRDSSIVEARLANLGTAIGHPIEIENAVESSADTDGPGMVRCLGGLRFSGWIGRGNESCAANVFIDGVLVTKINTCGWTHVGVSDDARAVRSFDLHLPERFADGRPHQIAVTCENGEDLAGSPAIFVAFTNGPSGIVAAARPEWEKEPRAALIDQLLPMSLPFTEYDCWRERVAIGAGAFAPLHGAVIMVGPCPMSDTLESLHRQSHADWTAVSLPATADPTGFPSELAQAFLEHEANKCDFVVFGLAGTAFSPIALQRIAAVFSEFQQVETIYGDVDIEAADGSIWPLAFPAFDYERMLEQGYCAHLFALRRAAADRLLATGATDLYRLFNSIFDDGPASSLGIVHLPGALGTLPPFDRNAASTTLAVASRTHLRQRGIDAEVTLRSAGVLPAARIARQCDRPRITIIIPTRNRRSLLQGCIESIWPAVKKQRAEIMVVDNDSADADTLEYLTKIDGHLASVVRVPGPFNFSRLNNVAARAASGDILCLLNNDTKALDDDWLREMVDRISEDDVGAVGALLVWPSGIVQHGGVVLGPNFAAAHAFNDRIDSDVGYGDLLRVAHECSAVTAACLVTRRRDYGQVGGMDEVRFPINFNDVDYCLKLRALRKRVVFTPDAKIVHLESASRGDDRTPDRRGRFERELQNLRAKWGRALAADPYYSPMLSLDPIPFSALAWPVRPIEPRINTPPVPTAIPPGF